MLADGCQLCYYPGMPTPKIPRNNCIACGQECKRAHAKFCSNMCQQKERRRLKAVNGTGGQRSLKRYIIEIEGHRCSICEFTHWLDDPIPLVLDHIDGNSENNSLDNLRVVCGNCDMQLPTYKSKNIGKGRHTRRKRYSEQKSY